MNRIIKNNWYCFPILVFAAFVSCNSDADKEQQQAYVHQLVFAPGDEAKVLEALLTIKDSTSILLKAGSYTFDNLSIVKAKQVLLKGEGKDRTILDFSAQSQGGEGLRITDVAGFTISDMTIRDSKGDLLKINKSRDIVVRELNAIWKTSDSTSGGYAIYPVLCKNVLVENCYAEGASDAGIYIGQSDSAVVRQCKAAKNVAGCEIENTTHAAVYNNEFYDNTAGFLVFDLPGLSQRGGHVKAYDNYLHDNNRINFAKAGSFGTSWGVGNAAPGSGVIILATSNVELYRNRIINNNSSAITIASGFAVGETPDKINDQYFPVAQNIKIYENTLEMGPAFPGPAALHHIGKLLIGIEQQLNQQDPNRKNKRIPLIMYDGISTNVLTKKTEANPDSICIRQTGDNVFVNADFLNIEKPAAWKPSTDMRAFVCQ
ncbi:parallel beta-helix domain-containing protein [Niabella drilacis]|uniref:Parallel beta-helix repeat-containing protein n=1 Tax=Niabella drilacis (strain DSM 25811 / CCM 8410 / CCUG 62505 / LMG 26954 / E90) TaxID=1285928 RepID=A0A1G6LXE5_NIADE|nr:parallel beta-helix domain-containing protein [Niabella drilacis]SDC47942.1 parallel beta-helix repeat-containing protein [Niabella drilacis]